MIWKISLLLFGPRYSHYLSYVFRHKWNVYIAGRKLGLPHWQLIKHDWTKFMPSELIPYARCFRARDGSARYVPTPAFHAAWNAHEKHHKHHWQYWVLIKDSGELVALPVPDKYRKEMLADWIGAGAALGMPDTAGWYTKNKDNITLNVETRVWIEQQLGIGAWS